MGHDVDQGRAPTVVFFFEYDVIDVLFDDSRYFRNPSMSNVNIWSESYWGLP